MACAWSGTPLPTMCRDSHCAHSVFTARVCPATSAHFGFLESVSFHSRMVWMDGSSCCQVRSCFVLHASNQVPASGLDVGLADCRCKGRTWTDCVSGLAVSSGVIQADGAQSRQPSRVHLLRMGWQLKASALPCFAPGRCSKVKSYVSSTAIHLATIPSASLKRCSQVREAWSVLRRNLWPQR